MQRAAQHQGQLPREQYGLVLRIAQAARTGAVYRLAGQPGTPARVGSRLTAESWQQHRELKRIGFQGVWNLVIKAPVQLDAAPLGKQRQQREWWRGVQVIDLAVTKIVLQQVGLLHVIAKGHAVEPRRQGFAFPGSRMQWPVWRWLHISSRSNCRRRSLGPV
ncbi:hypothetical protein G6F55_013562 [Rhizopus delemar]|nr:hypothetical protein G6F55_013562 [Rhizopus delemar]